MASKQAYEMLDIERFLKKHKKIMLEEHVEFFREFDKFQREFKGVKKVESKYGSHWKNCSWAYDDCTEGPDTCRCSFIAMDKKRAQAFVKFYEAVGRGKSAEKRMCCSIC